MLNIGANKGFNLAEWLQRYTAAELSNRQWHELLMQRAKPPCRLQCCGVCGICRRGRIVQAASAPLHLHAFELQPSNERLIRQLVELAPIPSSSTVEVHAAAVSNASGLVYTRDSPDSPGYESVGIDHRLTAAARRAVPRNVTTVDAFVRERGIARVALASIDTEGHDALVMRGMRDALTRKLVDVVEFEYMRAWKHVMGDERALQRHLAWLDGLGYTCFWQGNRGALAQASGTCWEESFHQRIAHRWSNLVCSHRADILEAMRKVRGRGRHA